MNRFSKKENHTYLMDALLRLPPLHQNAARAERLAQVMPLSHSLASKAFESVCGSGFLLSQRRLVEAGIRKPRETHETHLGTDGTVFLFASTFCYPNAECGFLYRVALENLSVCAGEATPFDSGGLISKFRRTDGEFSAKETLDRFRLDLVTHRDILRESLVKLFADPDDYLKGVDPAVVGPVPLTGGDRRRWTHEVRFEGDLDLGLHLEAVFVDRRVMTELAVAAFVARCRQNGVAVFRLDPPDGLEFDTMQADCLRHILKMVEDGWNPND